MNKSWLLPLLSFFFSSYAALHKDTLIHTTKGLVPVQQITPSDRILSSGPVDTCTLINSNAYSDYVYEIKLESEYVYVSPKQPLYDPVIEEWVKAQDLTHSNTLLDIHGNQVQCLGVTKLDTQNTVCELSLSSFHLFFIGKTGILAHNAIIFLAPAIPTTLAPIAKTSTIIGTIVGALWKAHSDHKQAATPNSFSTTASPPIKPPDEKKKTKNHSFSSSQIKQSIQHLLNDKNKIHHIFGRTIHKLDPLVEKLGSYEKIIRTVIKKLNGKVPYNGILKDTIVYIDNYPIHVRGKVTNGVLKIGTLFIP